MDRHRWERREPYREKKAGTLGGVAGGLGRARAVSEVRCGAVRFDSVRCGSASSRFPGWNSDCGAESDGSGAPTGANHCAPAGRGGEGGGRRCSTVQQLEEEELGARERRPPGCEGARTPSAREPERMF